MAARYGKPAVAQEILRHSAETKSPNHVCVSLTFEQAENCVDLLTLS